MAPGTLTVAEGDQSRQPDLRFLHFNDVYHVEGGSRDPVGLPELITLFSGDAFNPSLESSVTKGGHMVPVLNNIGTAAACVGNHDLDFGIPQYKHLTKQCNFPWLLANVFEPDGKRILGDSPATYMLTSSNGIKIGLIGIAEQEWLATVNALPPNLPYVSASETVKKYAPQLRSQGAEIIIALCHQREVHDNRLAAECPPGMIDIILAGHDHHHRYSKANVTHVLCSGSDFKGLSYIEARRKADQGWDFTITYSQVTKDIPEDPATVTLMDRLFSSFRAKLDKPIGYTAAPLDARFETVRKKESNLGNFIADLSRNYYQGDCALIVGGTIRGDQVYPPGVLRLEDIMDCFPFEDPTVMVSIDGQSILEALENSVSMYPALEGRFPQVSSIKFAFDPSKPAHQRITRVSIGNEPLDPKRMYKLVTREYSVQGGDDFSSLKTIEHGGKATYLVDEENGHLLSLLLRQYFMSLKILGKWKNWSSHMGHHWGGVHEGLHATHPVREPLTPTSMTAGDKKDTGSNASGAPALASDISKGKPLGDSVPGIVGQALRSSNPHAKKRKAPNEHTEDPGLSDSEDDDSDLPPVPMDPEGRERELIIMRRTVRKWWRLAGLKGHPNMCDEMGDEVGVPWTRGICPRVEGRIEILGDAK